MDEPTRKKVSEVLQTPQPSPKPNQEQAWVARVQFDTPFGGERRYFVRGEPMPEGLADDPEVNFANLKSYNLIVLSNSDEGIKAYEEYERVLAATAETPPSIAAQEEQAVRDLHTEEYIEAIIGSRDAPLEDPPSEAGGPDLPPADEAYVLSRLHDQGLVLANLGEQGDLEHLPEGERPTPEEEAEILANAEAEAAPARVGEKEVEENAQVEELHGPGAAASHLPPTVTTPSVATPVYPGDGRTAQAPAEGETASGVDPTEGAVKAAESLGVDLADVVGSGAGGRIVARDVQQYATRRERGEAGGDGG